MANTKRRTTPATKRSAPTKSAKSSASRKPVGNKKKAARSGPLKKDSSSGPKVAKKRAVKVASKRAEGQARARKNAKVISAVQEQAHAATRNPFRKAAAWVAESALPGLRRAARTLGVRSKK